MLHEILLSLSGIPSPVWDQVKEAETGDNGRSHEYISLPERAMLKSLSELSDLHIKVQDGATDITTSHLSLSCRAVASAISTRQLGYFRSKILDVESSILKKDAAYVGGYGIVSLSTIVTEFAPWTRRLRWLYGVVEYIQKGGSRKTPQCSSADIIGHLEKTTHTGYSDIEEMAASLLATAQQTWMRSVSVWILYGKLPSVSAEDFMVQKTINNGHGHGQCLLQRNLAPPFVSIETAETILAIGNALVQLKSHGSAGLNSPMSSEITSRLLSPSLAYVRSLSYPLSSTMFDKAMFSINLLVSKNALSHLLPLSTILNVLQTIQQFVLFDRGEFAVYLINNAEIHMTSRQQPNTSQRPVRKLGYVDHLSIKDSELGSILSKTFSELASLQSEHEEEGTIFSLARSMLQLRADANLPNEMKTKAILATILPASTVLQLNIPPESPLAIFISPDEASRYAVISSYLLSVRRAHIRLSGLWKLTSHRRCHPAPLAPPASATVQGRDALSRRRKRETKRSARVRAFWSSASKAHFVLGEIGGYLHGEVIHNSWKHFESWLNKDVSIDDAASGPQSGRPSNDPRTVAQAHRTYLNSLQNALLLNNEAYMATLHELCPMIDHFVALFVRLQTTWQGLDLEEDDGVEDAFINYVQEEEDILAEMDRTRDGLEKTLQTLAENLKLAERERGMAELTSGMATMGKSRHGHGFVPWDARTLDRLVMKLDFLTDSDGGKGEDDLGLVRDYDDDY